MEFWVGSGFVDCPAFRPPLCLLRCNNTHSMLFHESVKDLLLRCSIKY